MASRVIAITITGNNASALSAIAGVGTAAQRAATQSAVAFDASTGKIAVSFGKMGETADQAMSRVGKKATTNLTLPILAVGAAAGKMGLDFGTEIAKIEGLAGVPRGQIQGLRDDVLSLAGETAQSPQKLAQAMYFITSAGIDASKATEVLRASAQAATAGLGDVATVSQAVVGAVNAYASQNLTAAQATDILVGTIRNATFEADALVESIGPVNAVAGAMGVKATEVGAALAVLSQGGLDAETSVTALKGVMTQILKPTDEAEKIWIKMFGSMDAVRALLSEKGFLGVLQGMSEKLGGNQAAIAKLFPDVRGLVAALSLLGQKQEKVNAIFEDFQNLEGANLSAFQIAMETAGKDVEKGFAEMQVAAIRFGEAVGPAISATATGIGAISRAAADLPDPILKGGLALAGLAAAAGPGLAITGAFVRSFSTLGDIVGAVRAKIAAHGAATVSAASATDAAAVAQARLNVAMNAQAQAILRANTANAAYRVAQQDAALAGNANVATSTRLVAADKAREASQRRLAAATREVNAASQQAATGTGQVGLGALIGPSIIAATGAFAAFTYTAQQNSAALQRTRQEADLFAASMFEGGGKAQQFTQSLIAASPAANRVVEGFIQGSLAGRTFAGTADDLAQRMIAAAGATGLEAEILGHLADSLYKTAAAMSASEKQSAQLTTAQKRYADLLVISTGDGPRAAAAQRQLAAAQRDVFDASKANTGVQNQVAAATQKGAAAAGTLEGASRGAAGGLIESADAALTGANAFQQYAAGAVTAAAAVAAFSTSAFAPIVASVDLDKAQAQFADANSALTAPDLGGGGGGGGSSQTAIAALIEREQKELSLRDAYRSVEAAAAGVEDAELQLIQARRSNTDAARAVADAQQNLRTVLQGVARDSEEAKAATEALEDAQRSAAGAKLDVKDADRNLKQARIERPLAAIAVRDAQENLTEARGTGDQDAIKRAEIELARTKLAASAVNDTIKRAELALAAARDQASDSSDALHKSTKDLRTTLKGYPRDSQEAKDAQRQLTEAQYAAQQAAASLTGAQQGLVSAQDNVATSALGLKRSQADLAGQLDSLSGGGGAVGRAKSAMDSYKVKFGEVQLAAIQMAATARSTAEQAGKGIAGMLGAEVRAIKAAIELQPQLAAAFGPILDEMIRKLAALSVPLTPIASGGGGIGGPAAGPRFASGGAIPGSDPSGIPILAHPGEYVIQAKGVQKYGLKAMEQLNAGTLDLPKFAVGGPVDARTIKRGGDRSASYRDSRISNVESSVESTTINAPTFAAGGQVDNRSVTNNRTSAANSTSIDARAATDARSSNTVDRTINAPSFAVGGAVSNAVSSTRGGDSFRSVTSSTSNASNVDARSDDNRTSSVVSHLTTNIDARSFGGRAGAPGIAQAGAPGLPGVALGGQAGPAGAPAFARGGAAGEPGRPGAAGVLGAAGAPGPPGQTALVFAAGRDGAPGQDAAVVARFGDSVDARSTDNRSFTTSNATTREGDRTATNAAFVDNRATTSNTNIDTTRFGDRTFSVRSGDSIESRSARFDSQTVNISNLPKFAAGGSTGNGSQDGSLVIVHPNEFVIQKSSVEKYGEKTFEKLNAGTLPTFASGGQIAPVSVPQPRVLVNAGPGGGGPTYNITVNALTPKDAADAVVAAIYEYDRKNGPGAAARGGR